MATSYYEQFILSYLRESGFEVKNNSKLAGSRCRFDVFLPEYNIAVEYDSFRYHHSDASVERDNRKNALANSEGIRIIRIRHRYCPQLEDFAGKTIYITEEDCPHLDDAVEDMKKTLISWGVEIKNDLKPDSRNSKLRIMAGYLKKSVANNIAEKCPEIAEEWNVDMNYGLKPENFKCGSNVLVWWTCKDCKESWKAMPISRCGIMHSGCPHCNHSKKMRAKKAVMQAKAASVGC